MADQTTTVDEELDTEFAEYADRAAQRKMEQQLPKPPQEDNSGAAAVAGVAGAVNELSTKLNAAFDNTVRWVRNIPRNVSVGTLDAMINTAKAPFDAADSMQQASAATITKLTGAGPTPEELRNEVPPAPNPIQTLLFDNQREALKSYDAWRQTLRGDDNLGDELTQGVAQFSVPFTAYSKALGAAQGAGWLQNALAGFGSEMITSATAFDPHAGRVADLVDLGRHSEGKLGDVLRTLVPDDSLVNQYISWMGARENEGELEGRFKNAVDSVAPSAALAGFIKAAGLTFKAARNLPAEMGKNSPMPGSRASQQGIVNPLQVQETSNGFNVEHPHGTLEFTTPEDAQAHIEEVRNVFGPEYEARAAAQKADPKITDKNFATLHSFSQVLQTNFDKPVSTHSLVDALERNIKGDTEQGAFYKELLGRLKAKKLGGITVATAKEGRDPTHAGYYNAITNQVEIHPRAFKNPEKLLHTFAHEAVHAATVRELRESPQAYRKMSGLFARVNRVFEEADVAKQKATGNPAAEVGKRHYGMTNPAEFVAEIESNPEFRAEMKKVKIDGESAWDQYRKAIAGILGIGGLAANPEFDKLLTPQEDDGA